MSIDKNKIFFVLISLYPILIIVGPLTSLLNTLFIGLIYLIFFFKDAHYKILYKNKTLKALLLLYIYLILTHILLLFWLFIIHSCYLASQASPGPASGPARIMPIKSI